MNLLLDAGFQQKSPGLVYRDPWDEYAFNIYYDGEKWALHIYQRRWEGFYSPQYFFTCAEAAALWAFDFLEDGLTHYLLSVACERRDTP